MIIPQTSAEKVVSSSVLRMWAVLTVAALGTATQAQTDVRTSYLAMRTRHTFNRINTHLEDINGDRAPRRGPAPGRDVRCAEGKRQMV